MTKDEISAVVDGREGHEESPGRGFIQARRLPAGLELSPTMLSIRLAVAENVPLATWTHSAETAGKRIGVESLVSWIVSVRRKSVVH